MSDLIGRTLFKDGETTQIIIGATNKLVGKYPFEIIVTEDNQEIHKESISTMEYYKLRFMELQIQFFGEATAEIMEKKND